GGGDRRGRLRHGQSPLCGEGAPARGRERSGEQRPTGSEGGGGPGRAGSGGVSPRDGQPARARSGRAAAGAGRGRDAPAGHLPRVGAGLRALDRAGWQRRAGNRPRRGAKAGGWIAEAPAHRLERGHVRRPALAAPRRFAQALRVLPRPLFRARPRPQGRHPRRRRVWRPVRERRRTRLLLWRSVSPGEVLRGRPAPARQLRAHLRRIQPAPRAAPGALNLSPAGGATLTPAIDVLGGTAVRLAKGRFDPRKVYDEAPGAVARRFTEAGARALHVVDLDGAREGRPVNLGHLAAISTQLGAQRLEV